MRGRTQSASSSQMRQATLPLPRVRALSCRKAEEDIQTNREKTSGARFSGQTGQDGGPRHSQGRLTRCTCRWRLGSARLKQQTNSKQKQTKTSIRFGKS